MGRFEVLTGPERRRRWPDEEKLRILAEIESSGLSVAAVAGGTIFIRSRSTAGARSSGAPRRAA